MTYQYKIFLSFYSIKLSCKKSLLEMIDQFKIAYFPMFKVFCALIVDGFSEEDLELH